MKVKSVICLIFFFMRNTLPQDCEAFKRQWRNTCPQDLIKEKWCYTSIHSQKIEINRMDVKMDCAYTQPEKNPIPCLQTSPIGTLTLTDCQFSGLHFQEIVGSHEPLRLIIEYKRNMKADLRLTFDDIKRMISITIINVTAQTKFPITFRKTSSTKVEYLRIEGHNFKFFDESPFENLKGLQELSIKNGPTETFAEDIFHVLSPELKLLDLSSNSIRRILPKTFNRLTALEYLHLSKNRIVYLRRGLFANLKRLKALKLDRNRIRIVPNNTFRDLKKLELLNISENHIVSLPQNDPFGPSCRLTVLVKNCQLREMPMISWDRGDKLSIDLSHNYISHPVLPICSATRAKVELNFNSIDSITLSKTCSLRSKWANQYQLANNEPKCGCGIRPFLDFVRSNPEVTSIVFPDFDQLYCRGENTSLSTTSAPCPKIDCPSNCGCDNGVLDCRGKDLSDPPHSIPQYLTAANLANNNITSLARADPEFWNHVTHLNVSHNSLNTLDDWSFPPDLKMLDVSYNNLRTLPPDLMRTVEVASYFQICVSNNEWKCNCEFFVFREWFLANKRYIVDYDNTLCKVELWNGRTYTQLIKNTYIEEICPSTKVSSYILLALLPVLLIGLLLYTYYYRSTIVSLLYSLDSLNCLFLEEYKEKKVYDAFVCASETDSSVTDELLRKLEPYYQLCIPQRDWPKEGSKIRMSAHLAHSFESSGASLIVVSKTSLQETWFQVKFRGAYNQRLEDEVHRMILIVVGDIKNACTKCDIREIVDTEPCLLWGERFFWQNLRYQLRRPHRMLKYITQLPNQLH